VCLKFCKEDADCGSGRCLGGVPCEGAPTDFRICSMPCGPLASDPPTCASGMSCFIFSGEFTSCDCRKEMRGDGAPCKDAHECAPGLMCVGTEGMCRPICRLTGQDCAADRVCTKLIINAKEYMTWGACVPK
jgi:hypothetical protein